MYYTYTCNVLARGGQNEHNSRDLEQLKAIHGLIFQGAKCENSPKRNLECKKLECT